MSNSNEISLSTNALVKISVAGLTLVFFWYIRDVLVLLLVSVTIAAALDQLIDYLSLKKIPRMVSLLTAYLLVIALIVFVGYLVVPAVITQFQQLSASGAGDIFQNKSGLLSHFNLGQKISKEVQSFIDQVTSLSGSFFQKTLGVFNGVIDFLSVLVISFYLAAEHHGLKKVFCSVVPSHRHAHAATLIDKIQHKIGNWMIGQLILSSIVFLASWAGLSLLGVKYALVLAILAGFCELIPYIGPIIAAIPAVFFAFVQSPPLAMAVAVLYLGIQKTEGYFLVPKIMQKAVGVSPLFILVAVLIGLKLAGVFGVFLAVPVVAGITVYLQESSPVVLVAGSDAEPDR